MTVDSVWAPSVRTSQNEMVVERINYPGRITMVQKFAIFLTGLCASTYSATVTLNVVNSMPTCALTRTYVINTIPMLCLHTFHSGRLLFAWCACVTADDVVLYHLDIADNLLTSRVFCTLQYIDAQ